HREIGNVLAVGERAAEVHGQPARTAALGELVAQTALARSRLGNETYDLRASRLCFGKSFLERPHVLVATDEARKAARARDVEAGARRAGADETMHADRFAHALDAKHAEVFELDVARHQCGGRSREIAGVGRRKAFHALGEADGVALRGVLHAQVVADRADHDFAGVT